MTLDTLIEGGGGDIGTPPITLNGDGFDDNEKFFGEIDQFLQEQQQRPKGRFTEFDIAGTGIMVVSSIVREANNNHLKNLLSAPTPSFGRIAVRHAGGYRYN